jgi:hypothetical protein
VNERINQLAGQALDRVVPYTWTRLDYDEIQRLQEYFARLIVRECIDVVKPTPDHEVWAQSYLGGVNGLELLEDKITKIKQHFGVEE